PRSRARRRTAARRGCPALQHRVRGRDGLPARGRHWPRIDSSLACRQGNAPRCRYGRGACWRVFLVASRCIGAAMRSRMTWMPASLMIWASCPGRASAHLVNSGLGPFYDGVAHLFVTPEDLLVVVAVALLAGLGGKKHGRSVLFLLPLAWLIGGVVGGVTQLAAGLPVVSAVLLIASGALVAAASERWLSTRVVAGFALIVGLVYGFFNGAA